MTPLARAISSHLLGGSFPTGWGPVNDRLLSTFQDIKDIVFFFPPWVVNVTHTVKVDQLQGASIPYPHQELECLG